MLSIQINEIKDYSSSIVIEMAKNKMMLNGC